MSVDAPAKCQCWRHLAGSEASRRRRWRSAVVYQHSTCSGFTADPSRTRSIVFRGGRRLDRTAGPALSHPAGELVYVEVVPPGVDLAVADLEGPHDRQLKRLVGKGEDVHPLGHHDRTIGCDVDDAELDALDAWRARADERGEVLGD